MTAAFEKLHGISLNEGMVLCSLLHAPMSHVGRVDGFAARSLSQSNTSKVRS
jgi:hypothetical protein